MTSVFRYADSCSSAKGNDIPRTIFIHQNGKRGQVFERSAERPLFIWSGFDQLGAEKIAELPDMMFKSAL